MKVNPYPDVKQPVTQIHALHGINTQPTTQPSLSTNHIILFFQQAGRTQKDDEGLLKDPQGPSRPLKAPAYEPLYLCVLP